MGGVEVSLQVRYKVNLSDLVVLHTEYTTMDKQRVCMCVCVCVCDCTSLP